MKRVPTRWQTKDEFVFWWADQEIRLHKTEDADDIAFLKQTGELARDGRGKWRLRYNKRYMVISALSAGGWLPVSGARP
jgi:hypothetical protein